MRETKVNKEYLETLLNRQIEDEGLIAPHRQYKFHNGRRWKFDFAWPGVLGGDRFHSFAVEVDGGLWLKRGGHTTGRGVTADREKDAASLAHGWVVLRVTPEMVKDGRAISDIKGLLLRQSYREVHESGECHPLMTESATTVGKTSTRGGGKRKGTPSARKGKGKASRRPTPPRRPRRRQGPPVSKSRRRIPKEIEAYSKLSDKLWIGDDVLTR